MSKLLAVLALPLLAATPNIDKFKKTRGFVALWDFNQIHDGRFVPHQPKGATHDLSLEPRNYVLDQWGQGRPATLADFPRLGRGPFGNAIQIRPEADPNFRPVLEIPRQRLHDSPLDIKGPRKSVTLLAWVVRTSGNHAIAGIWHEGADLRAASGRRQYALFAGLAANNGASAAHVSENGGPSFGDRYARNLSTTPELLRTVPLDATPETVNSAWSVAAFVFDNARNTVTSYLDGRATEFWIEDPLKHPFYQWPAKAGHFPEKKPIKTTLISQTTTERTELREFPFTRQRITLTRDPRGRFTVVARKELAALRVNPFYFPHDLYSPPGPHDGGPFTVGRVIHSSRGVGFTGWIGAVAVFNRPLSPSEIQRLSALRYE